MVSVLAMVLMMTMMLCSYDATAVSAGTMRLSLATFGGPPHFNPLVSMEWAKEIETQTNGAVKITPYWGGSLLKAGGIYDGVDQGAADIGMDMPAYQKGRFPVAECIELPWGYPNSVVASQVGYDVITKFKPAELKEVHFFYLSAMGGPALVGNKPIRSMEDMKGLKVRTSGNTVKIVQVLNAAAISMPIPEVYDALRKKTVDCTLTGIDSLMLFKFAEVSKYTTKLPSVGYSSINWLFMDKNKWESLPAEIRQVFDQVSAKYSLINGKAWDEYDIKAVEYSKKYKVEFIDLSTEEAARWAEAMKPIREEYIAEMNAKGLPGSDIAAYIEERIAYYSK